MFKGHAAPGDILGSMCCLWAHGIAQATAESFVWVCVSVVVGVCNDANGLCSHMVSLESCALKLEGHAELALPLTGLRRTSLAPPWT